MYDRVDEKFNGDELSEIMWRTRLDEFNCDSYTFVINVFLNVKRVKVFKTIL